ncbi:CRISPR type III-B/RAMP module RAMP protein Cmr4 [Marinitoga hydrogenitolerans DSM 16785]|uniref:CRISPR type III-B/RAMP module RAMP protein Cmr4 n=1 Tax=Marinitoga hydrogenitolerans (strain DSM 16785 / JCM 12826 / AT1271) TaxID=1122195 RepID=A0A1M5A6H3_MARH1|nr:type III-B CRISPR module RAMP protein Cmr4 [Marinitoga hydrogenitolerans]SHF25775.1 CRISPR type III-B/RAMP module RAMP protein Cmr4 [Marinitoga hydrogenitolerans DSM 16785]
MNNIRLNYKILIKTESPLHINDGGVHIDIIDSTVIKDSVGYPMIPGTTLKGSIRDFFHQKFDLPNKKYFELKLFGNFKKLEKQNKELNAKKGDFLYDFLKMGSLKFNDAKLLFFPINVYGDIVYITSPQILKNININFIFSEQNENFNIEWILKNKNFDLMYIDKYKIEGEIKDNTKKYLETLKKYFEGSNIIDINYSNILVVSDYLMKYLVDKNYYYRTGIVVDYETGVAKENLLYNLQLVPEDTIFITNINYIWDYGELLQSYKNLMKDKMEKIQMSVVLENLFEGYSKYILLTGIGMGTTRGFGRIKFEYKGGVENGNN